MPIVEPDISLSGTYDLETTIGTSIMHPTKLATEEIDREL
jgi:hypothetical protein